MKMKDGEKMFAIYFQRGHCGNRPAKNAKEAVRLYMKDAMIEGSPIGYKAIEAVPDIHYTQYVEESAPPTMPAKKLTAKQIYDKFIYETNIVFGDGVIEASLRDIEITEWGEQTVTAILREWLRHWFDKNNIAYGANDDVAIPIDYYLCDEDNANKSVCVKTFQIYEKSVFAITDFRTFAEELLCNPSLLNTDYLMFEYYISRRMEEKGQLFIKDLLMKKIWQITRPMDGWPLSLQIANGKIRQIKSCGWNIKRAPKTFKSQEHFLSALEETIYRNPQTANIAATWRKDFLAAYEKEYDRTVDIPQWVDIKHLYET